VKAWSGIHPEMKYGWVYSVIHALLSLDGAQLPNVSNYEMTPVIFLNLNLPPKSAL
jgi:hypothetical protein